MQSNAETPRNITVNRLSDARKLLKQSEWLMCLCDGQVSQNWTPSVTHSIAAEKTGFKYQAHIKQQRDVISMRWLREIQDQQRLVPLQPHHYLYLSEATLQKMPDIDRFGDRFAVFEATLSYLINTKMMMHRTST